MTSRNDKDWIGNATQLLSDLEENADILKINIKSKAWPKAPHILSRRLNEIKINLRQIGIELEIDREAR